ncbi:hypothetical protein B0H19DRAFT_1248238 [Mycena capillaripes]|nr:hypothetical protein B0H19DRAFT_1248238 [Mycena capillaripes]
MSPTSLGGSLLFLIRLVSLFESANAGFINLTIDDTDTSYFTWVEPPIQFPMPTPMWAAASVSDPCGHCSAQPQLASATAIHNQTWHDGRNDSTGSLTFQGSDVFIYGIDLLNSADISFSLDGAVTSDHQYTGTFNYVFDVLFFAANNVTAGVNHTVSWVLSETSTNGTSALFDYAIITIDGSNSNGMSASLPTSSESSSTAHSLATKHHSKAGSIAGGVVGGVTAACLAGLLLWRRRRGANNTISTIGGAPSGAMGGHGMQTIQPFVGTPNEPPTSVSQTSKISQFLPAHWITLS